MTVVRDPTLDAKKLEELLQGRFETLPDMIAAQAFLQPDAPAVIDGPRTATYGELHGLMDRVAAGLQRDGLEPAQTIAICALSSIEYIAVFCGALRAGVAVSPLAPSSTPDQLLVMLNDCDAAILFLDDKTGDLDTITPARPFRAIALDGSAAGLAFADWLPPAGTRPRPVALRPEWPFNIIYSSGTTGSPKGIVHSHAMRWQQISRGSVFGYGPGAITLASTPLYSNTTLVSVLPTLCLGATLVLMKKFDAREFLTLAEHHRVTHAMLVPVQYRRIMSLPDFGSFDLSSFRMKFSTSAPFSAELKADVLARWPGGLIEFYGMTEGGGSFVLFAHEHPDKLHTVGQPPPGHEIRILGEDGTELPAGEVGEVVGRSGAMMIGYHNQPDKTSAAEWHSPEGLRFIRTGDIGRFDADGFFILMDRMKDVIISGGFNVYPSDIEPVLAAHPAVADCAVVGVPSELWGETPVGFFVRRAGAAASGDAILAETNLKLGRMQRLSALREIDELPRSPIGKVLKRELRDRFAAG